MSNEVMERNDLERLLMLADEKKYRQLKEELLEYNEVDIAALIDASERGGDRCLRGAAGGDPDPYYQQHHGSGDF